MIGIHINELYHIQPGFLIDNHEYEAVLSSHEKPLYVLITPTSLALNTHLTESSKDTFVDKFLKFFSKEINTSMMDSTICIVQDISRLKKEQQRLEEESYIFQNNPGLVFWSDQYGNIINANKRGLEILSTLDTITNAFSLFPSLNREKT